MFTATATTPRTVSEIAHRALAVTDRVSFDLPKFVATIRPGSLDIAPDEKVGSEKRSRLWALAYFSSLALYGLPVGQVWVPCYLCGHLFDAWTMDGEHVEPSRNGSVKRGEKGNLLLADKDCNQRKHQGQTHRSLAPLLAVVATRVDYPRGSASLRPMYAARPRRSKWEDSTPYTGR